MNAIIHNLQEQLDQPAEGAATARAAALPHIISASALLADEAMKPPPEIIKGIMAAGTKNVVAGSSKTNKTWLLLDLGIAVATGGTWMGMQALQGKVLYINLEILPAYLRKRLQALVGEQATVSLTDLDTLNLRGYDTTLERLRDDIIQAVKARGYILVIIDPIYKLLLGLDENRAGDIGTVCFELERIAKDTGAAVVYAAHFSKGSQAGKESVDRISGSGVYGRDADSLITLTRHAVDGCYSVEFTLRNHPHRPPSVVEWTFPRMVARTDLDPAMLKTGRKTITLTADAVLRLVPEGEGEHILKSDLIQNAAGQGLGRQRVEKLLRDLVADEELYTWRLARKGKKSATGFGRRPQPQLGGGVLR